MDMGIVDMKQDFHEHDITIIHISSDDMRWLIVESYGTVLGLVMGTNHSNNGYLCLLC